MASWRQTFLTLPGVALFSAALQASASLAGEITLDQALPLALPCLQVSDTRAPYLAALEQAGWTVATGSDEMAARAQILENYRLFNVHAKVAPDAASYDALIRDTLNTGAGSDMTWNAPARFEQAVLLQREQASVALLQDEADGIVYTTCIFAGNDLADVAHRLKASDSRPVGNNHSWAQAYDILNTENSRAILHWLDLPRPDGASFVPLGSKSLTIRLPTHTSAGA